MTRRVLFGAVAVVCMLSSGLLYANNQKNTFIGSIGFGSTCGPFIAADGPLDVMVQTNTNGASPLASVHLRWKMNGSDQKGNLYSGSFMGNGTFSAARGPYDLPYHAVMVGKGNVPNVRFEGNIRVFVTPGGFPAGAIITTLSATCQ
jgi:hypothetical protein